MVARTKRTVSQAANARAADRSPTRTVGANKATTTVGATVHRATRATEAARTEVKVAEGAARTTTATTTTNKSKHFVDYDTYG